MLHPFFAQAAESMSYWPLGILLISVAFILVSIIKLKLHPFLALTFAAILTGLLAGDLPGMTHENVGLFKDRVELKETPDDTGNDLLLAVKWSFLGFGNTAGGIGFIVALAAIIGVCMLGSGAADRVVRWLLSVFGGDHAGIVLLLSGFLLSIPVFFDTVFFLLIPLARALSLRTGKSYTLFVMAMAGAGAITHSMVPPTPGPLMIADGLKLDLGVAMMAGLAASILPAWLVLYLARKFDEKYDLPMREASGASTSELKTIVEKKDSELPNLFMAALPVAMPVVLISLVSILKLVAKDIVSGQEWFKYLEFFGSPNIAMLLAAIAAVYTLAAQLIKDSKVSDGGLMSTVSKAMEDPLQTAGVIILITGAGGAFGGMIRMAGVGETIQSLATSYNISLILLAWGATAVVRIAQGSATVAMITGVGLMSSVIGDGSSLPYHSLYIFLAIGFGSITLSWMNDSGFWVVQRLSGFTEKETLKTWSVMLTAISLLGLIQIMIFSTLFPMKSEAAAAEPEKTAMVSSVEGWASPENYPPLLPQQKSR